MKCKYPQIAEGYFDNKTELLWANEICSIKNQKRKYQSSKKYENVPTESRVGIVVEVNVILLRTKILFAINTFWFMRTEHAIQI